MRRRRPKSTLFPYTTLFRSVRLRAAGGGRAGSRGHEHVRHRPADAGGARHGRRPHPGGAWRQRDERRRAGAGRSEEHTSELQSHVNLVCRLLLEKKKQRLKRKSRKRPARAKVAVLGATFRNDVRIARVCGCCAWI